MEHWEDWQKGYQHGVLVIWPPKAVRRIVNRQRGTYDPDSAATCEAHITLTQPLTRPLNEMEWAKLQAITEDREPFEIQYGPLKSFLPYPCIWYEVQPTARILDLREALHQTGFFDLSRPHTEGFTPHLTITEGLSGPEVNRALLEKLQDESSAGSFMCQEICLIVPDIAFQFHPEKRLKLGC